MTRNTELKNAVTKRNNANAVMIAGERLLRKMLRDEAARRRQAEKQMNAVRARIVMKRREFNAAQNLINAIR